MCDSPVIDNSALNSVNSRFVTELVRDGLTEYSYDAELAGLSYTFDSQADGIVLTVDGYNDKLAVLAKVVFEQMKSLKVDPKRFEIIKDQVSLYFWCCDTTVAKELRLLTAFTFCRRWQLQRAFVNYRLEQPYQHAAFAATRLTQQIMWTPEEKLAELPRALLISFPCSSCDRFILIRS